MRSGSNVRNRMLARAADVDARPVPKKKQEPPCPRCGGELRRIGEGMWKCKRCELDGGKNDA